MWRPARKVQACWPAAACASLAAKPEHTAQLAGTLNAYRGTRATQRTSTTVVHRSVGTHILVCDPTHLRDGTLQHCSHHASQGTEGHNLQGAPDQRHRPHSLELGECQLPSQVEQQQLHSQLSQGLDLHGQQQSTHAQMHGQQAALCTCTPGYPTFRTRTTNSTQIDNMQSLLHRTLSQQSISNCCQVLPRSGRHRQPASPPAPSPLPLPTCTSSLMSCSPPGPTMAPATR